MSAQQSRIWALINRAAAEFAEDCLVSTDTQAALEAEGYELSRLADDMAFLKCF